MSMVMGESSTVVAEVAPEIRTVGWVIALPHNLDRKVDYR